MTPIAFDDIPGFSQLFRDFCSRKDLITSRFPTNTRLHTDTDHWRTIAAHNSHRALLTAAIRQTMADLPANQLQQNNLALLEDSTTLTVVTGQQTGVLTGALYTVLKAWSAVQLAQELTSEHSGLRFVPVFWVEDNDHDIDEISTVGMLDKQGDALELRIEWDDEGETPPPDRSIVHAVHFNKAITRLVEQMKEALPQTEFTPSVLALLEETYTEGKPMAQAFTRALQHLLAETGILFVSATALRQHGGFGELAQKEIERSRAAEAALEAAAQTLTNAGYHLQAQTAPLNLFWYSNATDAVGDGKRFKIVRVSDDEFQAGEQTFSREELLRFAQTNPERFSSNVVSRAAMQDTIFPNAAYIGGPGEIAYLAQTTELFEVYGVTPAAVVARHSATFVDGRAAQLLEQNAAGLDFAGLLRSYEQVEKSAMEMLEDEELAATFDATRASLEHSFSALQAAVAALDPTLGPAADRTKTQALQGVDALEGKARRAQKVKQEAALNKIRKTHSLVYPLGGLQERVFTVLSFINKYGVQAMNEKFRALVARKADKHYIVKL